MNPLFAKAFIWFQAHLIILICLSFFLYGTANAQRLHISDLVYRGAFSFPTGDQWAYGGHALAFAGPNPRS